MKRLFKAGFTLTEVMLVSGLSTVVLTGLLSVFLGSSRYVRNMFVEADLALRMRDLRERLLFQAIPPNGTTRFGGLLSSQPNGFKDAKLMKSGDTWMFNVPSVDIPTDGATPSFGIENLTLALDEKGLYETAHRNSRWLRPANLPFGWKPSEFTDVGHMGVGLVDELQFDCARDAVGAPNANYRLTLRYSLNGLSRVERVHIPIVGIHQRTFTDETFHDYSNK